MSKPPFDEQAFLELLQTHEQLIHRVCWVYCRSACDREDLFQEIVLRLWSAAPELDRARKASTWIYRIALNVAIDHLRRQRRRDRVSLGLETDQTPVPSAEPTISAQLEALRELFGGLSDPDRSLLLLHLDGNSHREVGEVLGISESNVGTRLSRLKKNLKQSLNSRENGQP